MHTSLRAYWLRLLVVCAAVFLFIGCASPLRRGGEPGIPRGSTRADLDGDGEADLILPGVDTWTTRVQVRAAAGATLLDELLVDPAGTEWKVGLADVGAPTPALLLQSREGRTRLYLHDKATARLQQIPWGWVQGVRQSQDLTVPLRPNPTGPGLIATVPHLAAGGSREVDYLYTFDDKSARMVPNRLAARPLPAPVEPADEKELVSLILESLSFCLPEETATYFTAQEAAEAFVSRVPRLPRDRTVQALELAPSSPGRSSFGAELGNRGAVVRGWIAVEETEGRVRAAAAGIDEVLTAERGADLTGDGTEEEIRIRGGELLVRDGTGAELLRTRGAVTALPVRVGAPNLALLVQGPMDADGQATWLYLYSPASARLEPLVWMPPLPAREDPTPTLLQGIVQPELLKEGVRVRIGLSEEGDQWYSGLFRYEKGAMVEIEGSLDVWNGWSRAETRYRR